MFGVPASNLYGSSFQVLCSNVTELIMSPPPMNGGIASSSARLAVEHADAGRAVQLVAGERRRSRSRAPARPRGMWYAACDAVDQHRARRARAPARTISLHRVDRAERVRHVRDRRRASSAASSSRSNSSRISSPRSSIGATRSVAPVASQTSCHGTMFEWCSIAEIDAPRRPARRARRAEASAPRG